MATVVLENILSCWSLVLVNTEERQDQGVELGILELSLHGTLLSLPLEHVHSTPEEMMSVVGGVGDDGSHAPHVRRGGDVRVVSSENLRGQVADSATTGNSGVVVHGRGCLTCRNEIKQIQE